MDWPILKEIQWLGFTVVHGQLASKSNRRQPRTQDGRVVRIEKSEGAKIFTNGAIPQLTLWRNKLRGSCPIEKPCAVSLVVWYRDYRSDVDAELFYDCLQSAGVVKNDRLIRVKLVSGVEVDKANPRVLCSIGLLP